MHHPPSIRSTPNFRFLWNPLCFCGKYSENSSLKPYNIYGWTKLGSELIIKNLDKYIVVRTRFFDKKNIKYQTAATDIFTSMIEVENLVKEINHFKVKYKLEFNIISDNALMIPEYKIYLLNI